MTYYYWARIFVYAYSIIALCFPGESTFVGSEWDPILPAAHNYSSHH